MQANIQECISLANGLDLVLAITSQHCGDLHHLKGLDLCQPRTISQLPLRNVLPAFFTRCFGHSCRIVLCFWFHATLGIESVKTSARGLGAISPKAFASSGRTSSR